MASLDLRIVRVGIEVNGKLKTYDGLAVTASGTKYANPLQNEAEITIYNLDKATQDYILTQTSPYNFNRTPKIATLEAGRASYGTSLIYTGNIVASKPSQPPDIGVTLHCLTGNFVNGTTVSSSYPGLTPLKTVSQIVANQLNTNLVFQTDNKNLRNYAYSGSALKQIEHLASMGNINAFVDNANLVIKTIGLPLAGATRVVNMSTGMIGIPELTAEGVKVRFLLDNKTTLGGSMSIQSEIYPAANGEYVIYKLSFEVSNRDVPFYWIAEGLRKA